MSDGWYRVGHTTDDVSRTGCSVILFDDQVPAAVDVRGGAPGTRETTLLGTGQRGFLDAVVLSGGSAFGLSTIDGVMSYLLEHGRGLPTPASPVPLVAGAIIYDLAVGNVVRPDAEWGFAAAETARRDNWESGQIGAGTGATVAKLGGVPNASGLGWGHAQSTLGMISAFVVLNAVGDVVRPMDGTILRGAGNSDGNGRRGAELLQSGAGRGRIGEHTTIGCILANCALDRYALNRLTIAAHDGLARTIYPAHTPFDGDTFFACARTTGSPEIIDVASACVAATQAVENAVLSLFEQS